MGVGEVRNYCFFTFIDLSTPKKHQYTMLKNVKTKFVTIKHTNLI
jgi:hypothetical protein